MAFELYVPQSGYRTELLAGQCSVDVTGNTRVPAADLDRCGLTGPRVAVLVDVAARMIALRPPRDGEATLALVRKGKGGVLKATGAVQLRRVLKQCGLAPPDCRGRYETLAKKDGLLVLLLAQRLEAEQAAAR